MSSQPFDGEVSADDVMQDEHENERMVVSVRVVGPVETRELPSLSGGYRTRTLTTSGEKILPADPKRKMATILSATQDIYVGADQSSVTADGGTNPSAPPWPDAVPLVITHTDEVWASSVTSTTVLTIITERWAR